MKNIITCSMLRSPVVAVLSVAVCCFMGCDNSTKISGSQITIDQTLAAKFTRHTVTGVKAPLPQLPDVPGFIGASFASIGDLNKDGKKDIVCTSGVGSDVNSFTPDGEVAVFTRGADLDSWTQSIISNNFAFPNETVLRDMDGDGNIDIMVMDNFIWCMSPGGIYYLKNKGGDITSPANWEKKTIYAQGSDALGTASSSYHAAVFLDLDGDGEEDFITSRINYCQYNANTGEQYSWIEWFKNEGGGTFSGPYDIGNGGGFLFSVEDVNGDGRPDVLAPQFSILDPGTGLVRGSRFAPDPQGASLLWFENPGSITTGSPVWKSYIIDYWYTSPNPMGKVMSLTTIDIDGDGKKEILSGTHNHQDFVAEGLRFWPAGIYVLDIPALPSLTAAWAPVIIDSGDPNLDPNDAAAVAADDYAVERPGGAASQGSPGRMSFGDINGDGLVDFTIQGDGKGVHYYYENQGMQGSQLRFKRAELYKYPGNMTGDVLIDDIDGDGKKDIISVLYDSSVNNTTASSSIFIFKQN